MDKLKAKYIFIIILVAISVLITAWSQSRPPVVLKDVQSKQLPKQIGSWKTPIDGDSEINKDVLSSWKVQKNDFLYRRYFRDIDEDEAISVYDDIVDLMLVYKGNERRGWHVSEMCFAGSGHNVEQSITTIPYGGKESPAVKLVAKDPINGITTVALYWFSNGHETECNFWKQQGLMAINRLRNNKNGWAFIRVTAMVKFSVNDTTDMLYEFIEDTSDELIKRVSVKE